MALQQQASVAPLEVLKGPSLSLTLSGRCVSWCWRTETERRGIDPDPPPVCFCASFETRPFQNLRDAQAKPPPSFRPVESCPGVGRRPWKSCTEILPRYCQKNGGVFTTPGKQKNDGAAATKEMYALAKACSPQKHKDATHLVVRVQRSALLGAAKNVGMRDNVRDSPQQQAPLPPPPAAPERLLPLEDEEGPKLPLDDGAVVSEELDVLILYVWRGPYRWVGVHVSPQEGVYDLDALDLQTAEVLCSDDVDGETSFLEVQRKGRAFHLLNEAPLTFLHPDELAKDKKTKKRPAATKGKIGLYCLGVSSTAKTKVVRIASAKPKRPLKGAALAAAETQRKDALVERIRGAIEARAKRRLEAVRQAGPSIRVGAARKIGSSVLKGGDARARWRSLRQTRARTAAVEAHSQSLKELAGQIAEGGAGGAEGGAAPSGAGVVGAGSAAAAGGDGGDAAAAAPRRGRRVATVMKVRRRRVGNGKRQQVKPLEYAAMDENDTEVFEADLKRWKDFAQFGTFRFQGGMTKWAPEHGKSALQNRIKVDITKGELLAQYKEIRKKSEFFRDLLTATAGTNKTFRQAGSETNAAVFLAGWSASRFVYCRCSARLRKSARFRSTAEQQEEVQTFYMSVLSHMVPDVELRRAAGVEEKLPQKALELLSLEDVDPDETCSFVWSEELWEDEGEEGGGTDDDAEED